MISKEYNTRKRIQDEGGVMPRPTWSELLSYQQAWRVLLILKQIGQFFFLLIKEWYVLFNLFIVT